MAAENITLDVVVRNQPEELGDFVQRVMSERVLTHREVERRSGGEISHSYVSKIISGAVRNVTVEKLRALARGLGVPEDELFAVARGRMPANKEDGRELQLLAHFRELPDTYKEDVLKIARMLNAEHGTKAEETKIVKKKAGARAA